MDNALLAQAKNWKSFFSAELQRPKQADQAEFQMQLYQEVSSKQCCVTVFR